MTRKEFSDIILYITAGCGKSLTAAQQNVYFDLLGHYPAPVGQMAARRVLLGHPWATFPSIAELSEAINESVRGQITRLTAVEAWEMAWRAICNIDPEVDGSIHRGMGRLPAVVAATIQALGVNNLCYGDEPVAVIRAQFIKAYDTLAERDKRKGLFTPGMIAELEKTRLQAESTTPTQRIIDSFARTVE